MVSTKRRERWVVHTIKPDEWKNKVARDGGNPHVKETKNKEEPEKGISFVDPSHSICLKHIRQVFVQLNRKVTVLKASVHSI
jgi:hypothetical protein